MLRDKVIYALTRYPGVTEEIAKKLKTAGILSPAMLKQADAKFLKAHGLKQADIDKIKARGKPS